ncbi:hypothetical protein C8A01DRAFT_36235 [Parachaetomium inaequale]|uniref:Uncharacterized protein n=1 Tax=Parachaetomium inaequale TaxID=2588326 RepID=A0AAN6SQX3_9PEZI|nr:hypothetical protein C8A01DRAFT_36235 [Parachaetomium inaequale]
MAADGQLMWNYDQDRYETKYHRWEWEDTAIRELKDGVLDTVSSDLLARARYKKATQVPANPPRHMERWLMEWESAVIEAKAQGVPETECSITWWDDFERVIRAPGIPSWTSFAQAFGILNSDRIDNNEISFGEKLKKKAKTEV